MILLLALLACQDAADAPVPPPADPRSAPPPIAEVPPPIEMPTGELIVRSCFGAEIAEGSIGSGGAPPPKSARRSAPAGAAPPPAGAPSSIPAPPAAPAPEAVTTATPPPPPAADPAPTDALAAGEAEPRAEEAAKPAEQRGEQLDWGAKVYLSNDDSMSLASAQHLLHAVKEDRRFSASEIRPHELLNYFSFETAPVGEGQLFSLASSAQQTSEDTLTLAMAVRGATPPRRPLDLTIVLDRSGSMSAEGRMEYTKRALALAAEQLQRGDRVDVVLFDDEVCTPVENFVVGRDETRVLTDTIANLQPRGGTNISVGLREAYRIVKDPARDKRSLRNRRVMLMTDAEVNQGVIDADALALAGDAYEQLGVRVTGVGVGAGFRDDILDKITEQGRGGYVYLGSEAVVDRLFGAQGFPSLTQTIAHDVQFELDLPDSLAMARFYGEEASTDAADVEPINYYAGTTQLFLQDLRVRPGGFAPTDPVVLTVRYREAATGEPGEQVFRTTVGELLGSDRRNLDKARALMGWTDMLTARAMGSDECAGPLSVYAERAARVQGDAEIAYVNALIQKRCPLNLPTTPSVATVPWKVKVDSDQPIAEVELDCGGRRLEQRLSGSDTVARFDATPGSCQLTLQGTVPLQAKVTVSPAGGEARCTVRAGRVSCS